MQRTHGMSLSPEFRIWHNMKQRCYNSKMTGYKDYGGRGIKVCKGWRNSFGNFFADMGKRPSKNHSIDRVNNDGNYTPKNCRWATWKEQNNNQRPRPRSGEYHSQARLSREQVLEIRSLVGKHQQKDIAKMFSMCPSHISNIINFKVWKPELTIK